MLSDSHILPDIKQGSSSRHYYQLYHVTGVVKVTGYSCERRTKCIEFF